MTAPKQTEVTAVLVHAAWADGSSWNKVTAELQRRYYRVVAAQIPLTSLKDDVDALRRILRNLDSPVILVGHSYGGAVISAAAAGDPNVKALVFVAAVVPDQDETVGQIFTRDEPHPKAPKLRPDPDGFLWLDVEAFREAVAPDATMDETALMAVNQKPISLKCLTEPMTKPAWKEKPSWFLVAENDRMVSPKTQRYTAERMNSTIVSASVDHMPLASSPGVVAAIVENAVSTTTSVARST